MVVIIFRSRLSEDTGDEYVETAKRMLALASEMPGFISFKTFTAEDGERVSIVEFDSAENAAAWKRNPEHTEAQKRARERFYTEYSIKVCTPIREYGFVRPDRSAPNVSS